MPANISKSSIIAAAVAVGVLVWLIRPEVAVGQHYGVWSMLPAFATIIICFVTRNVLLALLVGITFGGLIIGKLNIINEFLVPSLGTENYAQILLVYLWALGSLLGLWNRNGGARYFATTAANKFIRSRNSAKMFAWIMGVIFHQGGTISTVLTGTTVKPIADSHRVAREELAYVVDSTASPIATLIPFNAWPIYIAGLLVVVPGLAQQIGVMPGATEKETAAAFIQMFYMAIPFNFYAMFAIAMTFLFALDKLPLFGTPMAGAVQRVQSGGPLYADDHSPMVAKELTETHLAEGYIPSMVDFLAPIGTLLAFCIVPLIPGVGLGGKPLVFEGFGMAVVVSLLVSVIKGMSTHDAFDAMISGIKGVTIGAIVLGLSVTLAAVSNKLGSAAFVIENTQAWLASAPYILPTLLMAVCMIISFAIGSSWGTYAVVYPIALPLAFALSADPTFVILVFAAILGGAVFGDQCSPISDTTILSSVATGSDLMAHVNTQFPLALTAAGMAGVLYLILGFIVLL